MYYFCGDLVVHFLKGKLAKCDMFNLLHEVSTKMNYSVYIISPCSTLQERGLGYTNGFS